jgi:non-canonical (house-cleaning) NTP pyrophosphatase
MNVSFFVATSGLAVVVSWIVWKKNCARGNNSAIIKTINVAVGTTSAIKIEAIQAAFESFFSSSSLIGSSTRQVLIRVHAYGTSSGVNEQPYGLSETLTGAINRLDDCKRLNSECCPESSMNYFVAIENGLIEAAAGGSSWAFDVGIIAIEEETTGRRAVSSSQGEVNTSITNELK